MAEKEGKLKRAAQAVAAVVAQAGLSGVTHARVARRAGVSRPWLYRYVGPTREMLVGHAVQYFGGMFTDLKPPDLAATRATWIEEVVLGFERLLAMAEEYPGVLMIYFQYRGTQTAIGKGLEQVLTAHGERERQELERAFGYPSERARLTSKILAGMRIGLAHEWALGGARSGTAPERYVSHFREMLTSLLS